MRIVCIIVRVTAPTGRLIEHPVALEKKTWLKRPSARAAGKRCGLHGRRASRARNQWGEDNGVPSRDKMGAVEPAAPLPQSPSEDKN
jgi:hypothetical protein